MRKQGLCLQQPIKHSLTKMSEGPRRVSLPHIDGQLTRQPYVHQPLTTLTNGHRSNHRI